MRLAVLNALCSVVVALRLDAQTANLLRLGRAGGLIASGDLALGVGAATMAVGWGVLLAAGSAIDTND